jgi:hypothetical protein
MFYEMHIKHMKDKFKLGVILKMPNIFIPTPILNSIPHPKIDYKIQLKNKFNIDFNDLQSIFTLVNDGSSRYIHKQTGKIYTHVRNDWFTK